MYWLYTAMIGREPLDQDCTKVGIITKFAKMQKASLPVHHWNCKHFKATVEAMLNLSLP